MNSPSLAEWIDAIDAIWRNTLGKKPQELLRLFRELTPRMNLATARPLLHESGGEEVARAFFEAWDEAITHLLAPHANEILRPHDQGFEYGGLFLLAMALRETRSTRIQEAPPFPHERTSKDRLGADLLLAMTRSDGTCELDYERVMQAILPAHRPAMVVWFLGCYLASPLENVTPDLAERRRANLEHFVRFHTANRIDIPPVMLVAASTFAASTLSSDAKAFLSVLSDEVLGPTFAGSKLKTPTKGNGTRLVLTHFGPDTAVYRCLAPSLRHVLEGGPHFSFGTTSFSTLRLSDESPLALERSARKIQGENPDLLYFSEVGLTATSRVLAEKRIARVQATGYGHPVTTGSRHIDYFVGGDAIESDPSHYRERLLLLPGLGIASTEPPAPSHPRLRPRDGENVRFVSLASYAKLSAPLLKAWNAILEGSSAELEMVLGLPEPKLSHMMGPLSSFLCEGTVALSPPLPRQDCINLLSEADVVLDSFPFGGYNTLVEALSVGCPVVTLEGTHAYGRFGAALLRMLGMPSFLIANTIEEYVAAARRLLVDAPLRKELSSRLDRTRVLEVLCSKDVADHFDEAVRYMREVGPSQGPPVVVAAGEKPWTKGAVAMAF